MAYPKPGIAAWFIFLVTLGILALILVRSQKQTAIPDLPAVSDAEQLMLERTFANYKDSVLEAAGSFRLSAAYLLALIALESSGQKDVPSRFEPHVFQRLKDLKAGKRTTMERLKTETIADAGEDALKNLASSWGPFQIMGYKCVELEDKRVIDLRAERAIYYGTDWINKNYGNLLRDGRFKDAFHFHNTGRTYPRVGPPRTFHPDYVMRGLRYLAYFEARINHE